MQCFSSAYTKLFPCTCLASSHVREGPSGKQQTYYQEASTIGHCVIAVVQWCGEHQKDLSLHLSAIVAEQSSMS